MKQTALRLLVLFSLLIAKASAVTPGTQTQRGFFNDNVYHSETEW